MYELFFYILALIGLTSLGILPVKIFNSFRKYGNWSFSLLAQQLGRILLGVSVLITIYQFYSWALFFIQKPDKDKIDYTYIRFHESIVQKDYETAYDYMTLEYRNDHSLQDFQENFVERYPFPPLIPNRLISIFGNNAVLSPYYDNDPLFLPNIINPINLHWKKIDNEWYLTGQASLTLD